MRRHPLLVVAVIVAAAFEARSERLPVRLYGTAEGLSGEIARAIVQDASGFLWIGTTDGLSRFDGERFRNYGLEDGLPSLDIGHLHETASGELWVSTAKGVVCLNRTRKPGEPMWQPLPLDGLLDGTAAPFFIEGKGRLTVVAVRGVVEVGRASDGRLVSTRIPIDLAGLGVAYGIEDADGRRWFGGAGGLVVVERDGAARVLPVDPKGGLPARFSGRNGLEPLEHDEAHEMAFDSSGLLWMAHGLELFVLKLPIGDVASLGSVAKPLVDDAGQVHRPTQPGEVRVLRTRDFQSGPTPWIRVLPLRDGSVAGAGGRSFALVGDRVTRYTERDGLPPVNLDALVEDRNGGLWFASEGKGAVRVGRGGFVTYGEADGIGDPRITAVIGGPAGELYVASKANRLLHRLSGGRFTSFAWRWPAAVTNTGWGWRQTVLLDSRGEWWVATGSGLLRYPAAPFEKLGELLPKVNYTKRDGLGSDDLFRIFEDSRGDIWVSTFSPRPLSRWSRETGRFTTFGPSDGIPYAAPSAFAEDRAGRVWIGFYDGSVARYEAGRFEVFGVADGVPTGFKHDLLVDRKGRLWVASGTGGVAATDPAGRPPSFRTFSVKEGLASDRIRALAEGPEGEIYLGTTRGVDRLDPETGALRHFPSEDGLANPVINAAHVDREGQLWVGTLDGLSRLRRDPVKRLAVPRTLVTALRVNGAARLVPEQGTAAVPYETLPPGSSTLDLEFVAPWFDPSTRLRFQYRVARRDDFGPPTAERTVHFVGLSPGRYDLEVRAVSADRTGFGAPATFSFVVESPVWKRGWFLALLATGFAGAGALAYRIRVAQLLALERVRTQIATDLHDDLGSSLSRISILAEVVGRRVPEGESRRLLDDMGTTARELLEALSDNIWAIDPRYDTLASLVDRLRLVARDLLESRGVAFTIALPDVAARALLPPIVKRELLLVLKEAVNNVARHAGAQTMSLSFLLTGDLLSVELADDGVGLDVAAPGGAGRPGADGGRGLRSMAARVKALDGTLNVDGANGTGTRLSFAFRLKSA